MKTDATRTTVLGLDLGPSSIGWALLIEPDWETGEAGEVVASGVRIFSPGIENFGTGRDKSKSQDRREARAMRRQIRRRRHRKQRLQEALQAHGLLPVDAAEFASVHSLDPYELRKRALDERLDRYELGRVLMHLAARRGFLSNRKTDAGSSEASGLLLAMSELQQAIEGAGARTLGEYLYDKQSVARSESETAIPRVRGIHPTRTMLEHEFAAIWEAQQLHHPKLLTEDLRYGSLGRREYPAPSVRANANGRILVQLVGVHGLMFWQRRLYADPSSVGFCPLQPNHPRCERADRVSQRFRILTEVNNLRIVDLAAPGAPSRPLTPGEREKIVNKLWVAKQQTFTSLKKLIGIENPEEQVFNLEIAGMRDKLDGNTTDKILESKKFLGSQRWKQLSEPQKDELVRILLSRRSDTQTESALVDACGLTTEEANNVMFAPLPAGRAAYSRRALTKLLPYLEQGMPLVAKTGQNNALHAAGYQRPDEIQHVVHAELPKPPNVANPLVRTALREVHKTVNAIIREWGLPTVVRVELARDMKNTAQQRKDIQRQQVQRRKQRDEAAGQIRSIQPDIKVTRDLIDRYIIWKEQDELCMYSQRPISMNQLLGGEVDVDHILPRWRSLDDSLGNKVLVHRSENLAKSNRTVGEWLADTNPDKFERIQQFARLRKLDGGKRRRLAVVELDVQDFVASQLADTRFISREVATYLRSLDTKVAVTKGQLTAQLRRQWGLDAVLAQGDESAKNRADHRHHAVDACVVALTNQATIQRYSTWLARKGQGNQRVPYTEPWPGFMSMVERSVEGIVVSHKPRRSTSGALHEATVFGKLADGTFVRRKPIEQITTTKQLAKVRDLGVRRAIESHLRSIGIDLETSSTFPSGSLGTKESPVVRLPTKSGKPGPYIKSVRWTESPADARLRGCGYVKSGSNHHVSFFAPVGEQGPWKGIVTTTWDASRRAKEHGSPILHEPPATNYQFQFSLSKGETFEIDNPNAPGMGERIICAVRKIDRSNRNAAQLHVVHYVPITDARPVDQLTRENLYLSGSRLSQLHPKKVVVDRIGRVRTALD